MLLSEEGISRVVQKDQFRIVYRNGLERSFQNCLQDVFKKISLEWYTKCFQKGVFKMLIQKGVLGLEFEKKISLKKITQTSYQKVESEESRQFWNIG